MAKKKAVKKNIKDDFLKRGKDECCSKGFNAKSCGGCSYFLGFLGAAIYYISTSTGFWNGVWGVIKALVWPAFLVFELFKWLRL